VSGKSTAKIAKEMNMTPRSVYNWRRKPTIQRKIQEALDQMLGQFIALTVSDSAKGHRALVKLLKSDDEKVRLGAARALVADMNKVAELRLQLACARSAEPDTATKSLDQAILDLRKSMAERRALSNGHHETNGHDHE
jgi:hypothetical protein